MQDYQDDVWDYQDDSLFCVLPARMATFWPFFEVIPPVILVILFVFDVIPHVILAIPVHFCGVTGITWWQNLLIPVIPVVIPVIPVAIPVIPVIPPVVVAST
jgi:hypothetical protein